jgi:hypothetical protein
MNESSHTHMRATWIVLAAIVVSGVAVTLLLGSLDQLPHVPPLWCLLLLALSVASTGAVAATVTATTMPGNLAKWLLFICAVAMTVALGVLRWGNPLAGAAYWAAGTVMLAGLLPLCFAMAAIEAARSSSTRLTLLVYSLGLFLAGASALHG